MHYCYVTLMREAIVSQPDIPGGINTRPPDDMEGVPGPTDQWVAEQNRQNRQDGPSTDD